MFLRNPRDAVNGQPPENVFCAIDERSGEQVAMCVISRERHEGLFPLRPNMIRLDFEGDTVPDVLIGASLAKAREMCSRLNGNSRIYASCRPDDDDLLEKLIAVGFKDNDGVVRMRADLPLKTELKMPAGCVAIIDALEEIEEKEFFVARYNEAYDTEFDLGWLSEYIDKDRFARIITVAPAGMAGEVTMWSVGHEVKIDFINTSSKWRNMGVAKYMLYLASREAVTREAKSIYSDIRVRIPYILKTMQGAGFYQDALLMRYPGMDV